MGFHPVYKHTPPTPYSAPAPSVLTRKWSPRAGAAPRKGSYPPLSVQLIPSERARRHVGRGVGAGRGGRAGRGRRLGGLGGAALPGRVRERHAQPPQGAGCLPALRAAHGRAAVRLLPRRRHLPLQLLPQRLHLRRRQLHPGRLSEDPDQPAEQRGVPGHLARTGVRRLPLCQHHPAPGGHQFCGLTRRA